MGIVSSKEHSIVRSHSYDPFFNLALGSFLAKNHAFTKSQSTLLFLFQNYPCVMIGRNQNFKKEVNVFVFAKPLSRCFVIQI